MKLPRNLSGTKLIKAFRAFGYQHHNPLKVGTLAAVLDDVAAHFDLSREELLNKLNL